MTSNPQYPTVTEEIAHRAASKAVLDGSAPDITLPVSPIPELITAQADIDKLMNEKPFGTDKDRTEGKASVILARAIEKAGNLTEQAVYDPSFWRYVSLVHLWEFSLYREPGALGTKTDKDTQKTTHSNELYKYTDATNPAYCISWRMYLRMQSLGVIGQTGNLRQDWEKLAYSVSQSSDFWKSHIIRVSTSECPPLVRAIVRLQSDESTKLQTSQLREFAKDLNKAIVNLVTPLLDTDHITATQLVKDLWEPRLKSQK